MNIFRSLHIFFRRTFFVPLHIFVPFGTFFTHASTPTTRTTRTTKLLLGPLSRARGQKLAESLLFRFMAVFRLINLITGCESDKGFKQLRAKAIQQKTIGFEFAALFCPSYKKARQIQIYFFLSKRSRFYIFFVLVTQSFQYIILT